MPDISTRVKTIIATHLGLVEGTVTDGAHILDDLGADSLDTIELVMALEEAFGIEIPDDDAEQITTVATAIALVTRLAV